MLRKIASLIQRFVYPLSRIINIIGVGIIVLMMFLTIADICLRKFFNHPIASSYELIQFGMVILVFFALGFTQTEKGHIAVEILVSRLPQRTQAIIDSSTCFISAVLIGLMSWQAAVWAESLYSSGLTSAVLAIPVFPFLLITAFGCLVLSLTFIVTALYHLSEVFK